MKQQKNGNSDLLVGTPTMGKRVTELLEETQTIGKTQIVGGDTNNG